jgi:hypothetical protein
MPTPSPQNSALSPNLPAFFGALFAKPVTVVPDLLPQEFERFRELLKDDEGFPRTYGDWLLRTSRGPTEPRIKAVLVRFDEFVGHCEQRRTPPRLAVLTAYASIK